MKANYNDLIKVAASDICNEITDGEDTWEAEGYLLCVKYVINYDYEYKAVISAERIMREPTIKPNIISAELNCPDEVVIYVTAELQQAINDILK